MPKGFAQDTFEKLAELGKSTTKGSGKQIAKIINPKDLLNKALGREINEKTPQVQVEKDKSKHTPVNIFPFPVIKAAPTPLTSPPLIFFSLTRDFAISINFLSFFVIIIFGIWDRKRRFYHRI